MRSRKYRLIVAAERVNNRMTRMMLRRGWSPPWFTLLETTGRRSGQPRQTPVSTGMRAGDRVFWLVAAHGDQADYVRNIKNDPRVRVKVRGVWHQGVARLEPSDDSVARSKTLPYQWDAVIGRLMATQPLSVRIDLE